jgi:hypothetical protein
LGSEPSLDFHEKGKKWEENYREASCIRRGEIWGVDWSGEEKADPVKEDLSNGAVRFMRTAVPANELSELDIVHKACGGTGQLCSLVTLLELDRGCWLCVIYA